MIPETRIKQDRLFNVIASYDALAVAFSGGVDSTLLLAAAKSVLGERVVAFSSASRLNPKSEREHAAAVAESLGIECIWIESKALEDPALLANPKDRCFICKDHLFTALKKRAHEMGIATVAHGVNLDDLRVYRPGNRAAQIHGIAAPLVEAKLSKADVRAVSKAMGLPTWNRPAMSCLATRIPYGTPLTGEVLHMVEQAEAVIADMGFTGYRVRHHGPVARIEFAPDQLNRALESAARRHIVEQLRAIGYTHVAMDLEGYVSGSMDRCIMNDAASD